MQDLFKRFGSLLLLTAAVLSLGACAGQPSQRPQVGQGSEGAETTKASLPALEAAYKRNNDSADAATKYAAALRENNRLQRAAIVLDPFIQGGTANAGVYAEYGAVQAAMSNHADAEKYARKATAMDPNNGQAYHVLGIALDAEGKHDQAEIAFRKALEHWKGDPSPVLNNLGLNLAAQGFLDEAVETLRKAAADAPDRVEIARNLRIVKAMQAQSPKPKPVPVPPPKPTQG